MTLPPNARTIADYVARAPQRTDPQEVIEAARMCLADWLAVSLAARDDPTAAIVERAASRWDKGGRALLLRGGKAGALAAALVNGTLAHCLDYDDTHVASTTHFSGPLWATVMALGADIGASENRLIGAFVTGFEVGARIGDGIGPAASALGWHGTGIAGRLGATAAAAALLGLDAERAAHALGLAATQVGGLTASFGTMSKPFHVGKSAMDAILSVELAAEGFRAATDLLEPAGGLAAALVQDRSAAIARIDFEGGPEILRNTFKFYAACLLAHPAIDCARALARQADAKHIASCRVEASPLAVQLASRREPATATEAKFSIPFCVALGLSGYPVGIGDFGAGTVRDPELRRLAAAVEIDEVAELPSTAAVLHIVLADGRTMRAAASSERDRRVSWDDLARKFVSTAETVLPPDRATALLGALRSFGDGNGLAAIEDAVDAARPAVGHSSRDEG
jgi:2-methylcitrate dehydratase PrpD